MPKYGSILKITPEMMTAFFALPEGAKIVDVEYDFERDLIGFKIHADKKMREYGLEIKEGQQYPNAMIYLHKEDIEDLGVLYGKRREANAEIQEQTWSKSNGND